METSFTSTSPPERAAAVSALFREAARAVFAHDEAVDDDLDIVLLILVEGYLLA